VFIENEAGSDIKHHHNEARFVITLMERLEAPFPYPYGFVPGTLAPDGDAVDCFVVTDRPLRTGDRVTAEIVGLMEQTDAGGANHDIVAVLPGEAPLDLGEVHARLAAFISRIFRGIPDREATPGRLLPVDDALAYLAACTPPGGAAPTA
jgi:inorganic pyrophosphatase